MSASSRIEIPSHATGDRRRVWVEALLAFGLMLGILASAYAPVLSADYFFYDDYPLLGPDAGSFKSILVMLLPTYRPGYAVWLSLVASPDGLIPGSAYIRLLGVISLTFLCFVLYGWACRRGIHRAPAFAIALLVSLMPAFQSTIGYTVSCVGTFCCLFSALAAVIVLETWTAQAASRRSRAFAFGASVLLIAIPVMTYQPPAMFCWVLVAIAWLAPASEQQWRQLERATYAFVLAFISGLAVAFVASRALLAVIGAAALGRTTLVNSVDQVVAKLDWFWADVIPAAFLRIFYAWSESLWMQPRTAGWVIGGLLVVISLMPWMGSGKALPWRLRFLRTVLPASLLMLSYTPSLIVRETVYLTLYFTALQATLVVLLVGSVHGPWTRASSHPLRRAATAMLAAAVLVSTVTCNRNMMQAYVIPNVVEYRYVKSRLVTADLTQVTQIHVKGHLNFSPVLTYGEMLVSTVLGELKVDHPIKITSSSDEPPPVIHPEIMVRNPDLLGSAYAMTPHGFYEIRKDISPEEREAIRAYFSSLPEAYRAEGAFLIDLNEVREMVGVWKGMF